MNFGSETSILNVFPERQVVTEDFSRCYVFSIATQTLFPGNLDSIVLAEMENLHSVSKDLGICPMV